ncbi:DNA-deoxyinosine glycosylase [Alteribacillus sp. HJP-4]|uniref:DNA-deoxyinosine glycosylase n=1 Tax=Alteribacillus sp. HJP-4 TaxID=2775394 RepID=UPI0035CD0957
MDYHNKIYSFEPVIAEGARVLVLGSMPGKQSLQKQQYYANPRNQFWEIIFTLFNKEDPGEYEDRKAFLKARGIALWDSIYSCERSGSLDSSIKYEEPNDITGLLKKYHTIQCIAFNGGKSFTSFQKYHNLHGLPDKTLEKLPSTSPVPGKYIKNLEEKIEDWKVIKEHV